MVPEHRSRFNAAFTDELYTQYKQRLVDVTGCPIEFRVAETPVFLPDTYRTGMVTAAEEIIEQLLDPEHQKFSLAAVPPDWDAPGCDEYPQFIQVDFAVTRQDGQLAPRLIELQGFPSLYAFQVQQAVMARHIVPGFESFEFGLSGLDEAGYKDVIGRAILGQHDPENVILLDIDPDHQKTRPDFELSRKFWGVRAVCPTALEKRGRKLWYQRDGKWTPVHRIYYRIVVDELVSKGIQLPFSYADDLDVEWAPHPNWFFRWSKHSLPRIDHPTVPKAHFLSDLDRWPDDLSQWVLKPLFSFAGGGVKVDPTIADLDAIPPSEHPHWILMRKIEYAPVIETTDDNHSKCEVRIMLVIEDGKPMATNTLIRLSQGKMMGVDFNRNRTWVGSSASLWAPPA